MINKTRKMAILSLCLAIALSCVLAIVPQATKAIAQETAVAQIGETQYDNFADALAAAKAATGNVTVKILKKVTINSSLAGLDGSYDSLTFEGEDENAEIYLDIQGYASAAGKNLTFKNLKLSKVAGGYIANAGFMNLAFGVYETANITYNNCTFLNGAYASCGNVTFNECTFYRSHDRYGLWAYGNVDVTVLNSKFADIRGIKMYDEGKGNVTSLTVGGTDFSAADNKPAIVMTYAKSVTLLAGNTYSSKGVFELDLDGNPNGVLVSSVDSQIACVNDNGACGVLVDGKIYTTVAQAAAVATDSSMITLLHNSAETVNLEKGFLNKNGFEAANVTATNQPVAQIGSAYYKDIVSALKALKANDTLTLLEDVTFEGNWDSRYQGGKITVPVTIDGNGHTLAVIGQLVDPNYSSLFRFEADATVKNLTVDLSGINAARFRAISAKAGLIVDNCEFIGSTAGTNTRAIIFGEGAGTLQANVSITNSTFSTWTRGIIDNENAQDTAPVLVITGNTFNRSAVNVSASESIVFNSNKVDGASVILNSHTNKAALALEYKQNELSAGSVLDIKLTSSNITTDAAVVVGNKLYATTDAFLAEAVVDGTLSLTADVKLNETLVLPEDVTIKANGHVINGTISVTETITFADHVKVTALGFGSGLTINIPVGGCLELTASGRMTIGWNNTFNITGSIADAKTADVANVQPSLIANGVSFAGTGVEFNATNAYIKFPTSYCSSSTSSTGVFNFNIENSIFEVAGKLAFDEGRAVKSAVNFNLKDSVLTTGGHLVFSPQGVSVIDNSNVNFGKSNQLENYGTLIVKNGSVVNGTNASSANANMAGTLIVDNATYATTGEFTASTSGIGTLIAQNGANVTLGKIAKTNVYKYSDATIKVGANDVATDAAKQVTVTNMSYYAFELSVDKHVVKATESVNVTILLAPAAYAVEYTFTYDETKFSCEKDTDNDGKIYGYTFNHDGAELASYDLVALNNIDTVLPATTIKVTGNVVATKELALTGVENIVAADSETIKITLKYSATVHADYVQGYSLVLVSGIDAGYAYAGVKMIFVTNYNAFAILVEGRVDADMIEANLAKATTACASITKSGYDVNVDFVVDGKVDLKDATAAYACSMKDFSIADYMALYLHADVNGDFVVDMDDVNTITANYTR